MPMYKRPYPYPYPSYYHQQPMHQENLYYEQPVPQHTYHSQSQQAYYPNPSPYGFVSHQKTPFEQFAKPKQPMNWYPNQQQQYYPPPPNQPNHTQQVNNLKAYFQDSNGQVDFDKMFSTVGQLANTVQQVSPVIKQVGSLIKNFK